MALVLSPLLDSCEHGGVPEHVRHDAKHDLVSADVELLQGARLPSYVSFNAVLRVLSAVSVRGVSEVFFTVICFCHFYHF